LLAAALNAERRGAIDEAERWLDRLMSRYPTGQLADSARAARHRLELLRDRRAAPQ
jgi:TolA-binding protein